jgi:ligand-binding sensor domain-containing protein
MKLILFLLLAISGEWESFTNCDLVYNIKEKDSLLYLATNGGVVVFDPSKGRVERIYTNIDGLPSVVVKALDFDSHGNLWAVTEGGVVYLVNGDFSIYPRERLPLTDMEDIVGRDGYIYIASHSGLTRINTAGTLDPEDDNIVILTHSLYPEILSDTVRCLFLFRDTLYVGTERGLVIIPVQTFLSPATWDTVVDFNGLPPSVYSILKDTISLIVGTDEGLYWKRIDSVRIFLEDISMRVEDLYLWNDTLFLAGQPEDDNLSGVWKMTFEGTPVPLFSSPISGYEKYWKSRGESIFVDSGDRIWAGFAYVSSGYNPPNFLGGGLLQFINDQYEVNLLGPLRTNLITSMAIWNGGIWMAGMSSKSIPYPVWGRKGNQWVTIGETYELKYVYYMKVGPEGHLWVCSYGNGVYEVDTSLQVIEHYEFPDPNAVTSIAFTRDGKVIVAVHSAGTFSFPKVDPQNITLLDMTVIRITFLEVDSRGRIWICSEDVGCLILDPETGEKTWVNRSNGLPEEFVTCIKSDGETMWIGTLAGLAEYRGDGIVNVFLRDDPLYGTQRIKDIEPAPDGRVWILTEEGLFVLEPESNEILDYFNPNNSLLIGNPNNYWVRNPLEILDGEIWIGTAHGASMFKPELYWAQKEGILNYIYPNPLVKKKGMERIYITGLDADTDVEFFTISGEKLRKENLSFIRRGSVASINAKNLKPGLYLAVLKREGERKVLKFSIVE